MILVEDPGRLLDVEVVVGRHVPGQADQPVDVGPDDPDLGRCGGDPAHPVHFLDRAGLDLVGHAGRLDLVAQLVDLGLLRIVLTQLALDRLELLAQDVLALGLVHLGLDFRLDPALQLEDLDLVGEEVGDELEPLGDVDRLEHLLALLGRHVRAVGDHVGQQAGLADVPRGDRGLGRDGRAVRDVLLDLGLDRAHQRLDLEAVGALVGELLDGGPKVRLGRREAVDAQAALALDDRPDGAVLELHDLGDLGQRADGVELGGIVDVLLLRDPLGHQRDGSAVGDRGIERVDALLATDLERDDHLGKDDRLPEGDERQLARSGCRCGLLVDRGGRSLGHCGSPRSGMRSPGRRRRRRMRCRWCLRRRGLRGSVRRGAPRARTGCGCPRG